MEGKFLFFDESLIAKMKESDTKIIADTIKIIIEQAYFAKKNISNMKKGSSKIFQEKESLSMIQILEKEKKRLLIVK